MLAEARWQKLSPTSMEKTNSLASSAGNKPADKVNPIVVQVMKEKGIDISNE